MDELLPSFFEKNALRVAKTEIKSQAFRRLRSRGCDRV